jgi:phosphatidylserine/phosphatidylglycerophosphate/cardiolipin synthase-like enzyme
MKRLGWLAGCLTCGIAVASCGGDDGASALEVSPDGEMEEAAPGGKADTVYGSCEVREVVAWVNDLDLTYEAMRAAGVHTRAARNVIAHRDGADGAAGTADDDFFDGVDELDGVPYVGPTAFQQMASAVKHRCERAPEVEVIFSPQLYGNSHLARVAKLIDAAERSIDIAMYSFSDSGIRDALQRAVQRGVSVRFLFDTASEDRKDPAGTASAKLEDIGIDVRYVNKIMHHKFALIDGPREDLDHAYTATLVTGSGNWSHSAGTKYDENTAVVRFHGELALRFQKEFNGLWDNSRDFVWTDGITFQTSKPITDWVIPDDPTLDAFFTSANFDVKTTSYGPTFSVVSGRNEVADRLVALIGEASESIHLASGHLRSRSVAEALLAKAEANPQMDIRVYLDGQEYISAWYDAQQQTDLETCLAAAGDSLSKQQACLDKGFYYSYRLHAEGVPLRFKYSCYRWDYHYAVQMHHKYALFDGRRVASGSYNLSDNAEHNTMENVVLYDGGAFAGLAGQFDQNFETMWVTGIDQARYEALVDLIQNTDEDIPLVFEPMSLTWQQVTDLKDLIRTHCPAVDSDAYRQEPDKHTTCPR